jgi:hypothetical protein
MPWTTNDLLVYSALLLLAGYPFLLPAVKWLTALLSTAQAPSFSAAAWNRVLLVLVAGLGFMLYRSQRGDVQPVRPPSPATGLAAVAQQMSRAERQAMSEAYEILARAVDANPVDEPVFDTTSSLRDAHRAALLVVWQGVLGSRAGKYPDLREQLEGAMDQRIGREDVPLTPTLQEQAAKAFRAMAADFKP